MASSQSLQQTLYQRPLISAVTPLIRKSQSPIRQTKTEKKYFHYTQIPNHLQDNEFIHNGYRAYYTATECIKIIFEIHNETGNIWSHLIGFFVMASLMVYGIKKFPEQASWIDYAVFVIFNITACKCLLSSTLFHIFLAHHHHSIFVNCVILDYTGISTLIFGSFTTYLYYSLYCHDTLRSTYLLVLTLLCGSGVVLPWFDFFRSIKYRMWRTSYFIALVAILAFISIHSTWIVGFSHLSRLGIRILNSIVKIEYFATELMIYLFGALIYASKYPEKLFPGKLDHWLHSHQFWHVLICLGTVYHYHASWVFMVNRLSNDTCVVTHQ